MLVFVVLCMVIFAVIALMPALTDDDLVQAEVQLVQDFFAADSLAEQIVAQILNMPYTPEEVLGVEMYVYFDWMTFSEIVSFGIDINDSQMLFVQLEIDMDNYQILAWRMMSTHDWEADEGFNLWQGEELMGW